MRIFVLLTVLLALVSCNEMKQEPVISMVMGEVMEEPDRFPEITFLSSVHQTLQPGTYRINFNGFEVSSDSRLQSVYIGISRGDERDILRIAFNPQPRLFTADDEMVVRVGDEIVVGIKGDPKILTEELGTETHNIIEYEGTAIANLTRSHIIFDTSPSIEPKPEPKPEPDPEPEPEPDPEPEPEPGSFSRNDRVIVKNTLDIGLLIRNASGGTKIGGMFNGETGTIISGPETANGLVWFEIEWDRPVKDPRSGCGDRDVCVGWSVALLGDGTEVLAPLE